MNTPTKLQRAVIKEELVALTGKYQLAIVLNQMIYWSEKRNDADRFIQEEVERIHKYAQSENELEGLKKEELKSHGWIYKKAEELSEETMIGVKPKAMREYLKELVEKGWLDQRRNPLVKMDRTLQYRVNLIKIQQDLNELGYFLEGYSMLNHTNTEKENSYFPQENTKRQKENRTGEKENRKVEKEKAIPEITTEITTNVVVEDERVQEKGESDGVPTTDQVSGDSFPNHKEEISQTPKIYPREQAIQQIEQKYLQLRGAAMSSPLDIKDIKEVVDAGVATEQAIEWMEEVFKNYKPKYPKDSINSFGYVAKTIFKKNYQETERQKLLIAETTVNPITHVQTRSNVNELLQRARRGEFG